MIPNYRPPGIRRGSITAQPAPGQRLIYGPIGGSIQGLGLVRFWPSQGLNSGFQTGPVLDQFWAPYCPIVDQFETTEPRNSHDNALRFSRYNALHFWHDNALRFPQNARKRARFHHHVIFS